MTLLILSSRNRSTTVRVPRQHVYSVPGSAIMLALLETASTALPRATSRVLESPRAPLDADPEVELYEIWYEALHCIWGLVGSEVGFVEAGNFPGWRGSTTLRTLLTWWIWVIWLAIQHDREPFFCTCRAHCVLVGAYHNVNIVSTHYIELISFLCNHKGQTRGYELIIIC
jgi:hypothetical protein